MNIRIYTLLCECGSETCIERIVVTPDMHTVVRNVLFNSPQHYLVSHSCETPLPETARIAADYAGFKVCFDPAR